MILRFIVSGELGPVGQKLFPDVHEVRQEESGSGAPVGVVGGAVGAVVFIVIVAALLIVVSKRKGWACFSKTEESIYATVGPSTVSGTGNAAYSNGAFDNMPPPLASGMADPSYEPIGAARLHPENNSFANLTYDDMPGQNKQLTKLSSLGAEGAQKVPIKVALVEEMNEVNHLHEACLPPPYSQVEAEHCSLPPKY